MSDEGQATIVVCLFKAFAKYKSTVEGTKPLANPKIELKGYKSKDKKSEATKPVKENFVFAGWYEKNTDGSYKESEYDFSKPVESDLSLYAKWDAAAVKLEADGITAVYYKSLHFQ